MTFSDWVSNFFQQIGLAFGHGAAQIQRAVSPTLAPMPNAYSLTISANGLNFIAQQERYMERAYKDSAGYWTIGYGHRIVSGDGLSMYSAITPASAYALLRNDAQTAINCVRSKVKVPVTQNQFDALVSLAFNIGCGNFASSTLLRQLNAGNFPAAANAFLSWVYSGGKFTQGLQNRRYAERSIFLA